ncbi:LOW QUALITY PROTEIN: oxysterol-binding protein 1-like [Drosophila sulfurigaster albostrigata]|uniref:LOW QUALITY PROTEIN: oxysterol-binding protein 1-like n=1 Tax=Drosophila sulfurigaster albostrigata TaxID=89887 RepID=UPI002D21A4F2|nr:LOW QUALITY PROTEIN: oxysterol-binding protein 1-like [Drosophila sulfurigaster albostrigata]
MADAAAGAGGAAAAGGGVAGGTAAAGKPEKGSGDPEMKGWLLKWTNYIKGYQRRWFVLSKGVLSYYRNQSEINHTCRGTISLHGALIHTVDSCTFVISNGGTQTFHIKAANEVERQSWVTSLELAKVKAIRAIESEEEEAEETAQVVPSQEIYAVVRDLTERLENMRTCYDLITKHGAALQRALNDLESNEEESLASRTKIVNERATLFRITSNAMINAGNDYLRSAESQGQKWSKMLHHEREQRQRLEEIIEQMAKQQSQMEQAAVMVRRSKNVPPAVVAAGAGLTSDDETEFFDAEEHPDNGGAFILKLNNRRSSSEDHVEGSEGQTGSSSESDETKRSNVQQQQVCLISAIRMASGDDEDAVDRVSNQRQEDEMPRSTRPSRNSSSNPQKVRRTRVPDKPNYPLSLWSIMKNCIGKDLSKIPMPVNFNEPLSMLQRLTEDYEYADILDVAAACTDECEQLAYLAAFTASAYATTTNRTGKPFNPLLGETFECDRMEDLGWRSLAEQVSHHPPIAAIHCEGRTWQCWQEFSMTSKFRGKYVQINPLGGAYVLFQKSGHRYSWRKVTTTVNNIIVGKLWVDQHGEMEIKGSNAAEGIKCILNFVPYSYFSREVQRTVKGVVIDRKNEVKWVIRGTWDDKMEIAPVLRTQKNADNPTYITGDYRVAWKRRPAPPESEKFYNFTTLACQLNEFEDDVAPTDARRRPDQRLMEDGAWDESNQEKLRLEEKQRTKRREREAEAEAAAAEGRPYPAYEPMWFKQEKVQNSDEYVHVFKNTYWDAKAAQDWSGCPDIY